MRGWRQPHRVVMCGAGLTVALGCSWERFDEISANPPVVDLTPPAHAGRDFATSFAVVQDGPRTQLLVAGPAQTSGAAAYLVGDGETPGREAVDLEHCPSTGSSRVCSLAAQPVGMKRASSALREHANCFVSGVGRVVDQLGLWVRCENEAEFTFPVPDDVEAEVVATAAIGSGSADVALAADATSRPTLLAGVAALSRAFYYEEQSRVPVDLEPPGGSPGSFGKAVAVLGAAGARLLAVAAPDVAEVYLFLLGPTGPAQLGCLTGAGGFGRVLAVGDVDADGSADLAAADNLEVTLFSGRALQDLSASSAAGCSLSVAQSDLELTRLRCQSAGEVRDCSGSRFGASLAIADFDGDGAGEVAVGAPRITVRGHAAAGAVLVFDLNGQLVDARYSSTAAPQQLFGLAMTAIALADRAILAVSAPGRPAASLVYCTSMVGSGMSARCP